MWWLKQFKRIHRPGTLPVPNGLYEKPFFKRDLVRSRYSRRQTVVVMCSVWTSALRPEEICWNLPKIQRSGLVFVHTDDALAASTNKKNIMNIFDVFEHTVITMSFVLGSKSLKFLDHPVHPKDIL